MTRGPSVYGADFDVTALKWAYLEAEHDKIHPNRSDCGGVGGCTMMLAAHDLKTEMIDALEIWRLSE
ncbi:MAG: hypothetical protein ABW022_08205 [Actinoplanes sp.]